MPSGLSFISFMNHHVFKSGNVINFSDEYTVYVFVRVYKPPSKYSPIAS